MKAIELRNKYIKFFEEHGHKWIPSASLVPENDPTALFNTAGMQPLVPYLLGQRHPLGKRIVSYQKCLRTVDLDNVGDDSHLTFFEMLGNWSLGDYFKEESIKMSYEFLTTSLNIPVEKLSVTVFEGDEDAPRDEESAKLWEKMGIPRERIYYFGKEDNWWGPAGETGPCGPDTEIFYDTGKEKCGEDCNPACPCGKYLEIWNNVFMEYNKIEEGKFEPLKQKNVDTGLGLDRVIKTLQGKSSPYETEIFKPIMDELIHLSKEPIQKSFRIIADHLRSSIMLITDGVRPSNVDQGYILRRLIRRAIRHLRKVDIDMENFNHIVEVSISTIREMYPEVGENKDTIVSVLEEEKNKFMKTLENGEREFHKIVRKLKEEGKTEIEGKDVFKLYETYGFPPEITDELAKEQNFTINEKEFHSLFKKHQELSRAGAEQKFKGGLADNTEKTTAYHTATHLLHKALKIVLGEHVNQKGSNITDERLRFDFSHPAKMTPEEIQRVEEIVNEKIKEDLIVVCEEMSLEEAKKTGATGLFEEKYGEKVKVYSIGDFSKEICGGPHVKNTGDMGIFKIKKEEASSSGVRRIKAVLVK